MSDALAASILAKLTSWYDFEGDLTDAHGPYDLTADVLSGFEAGKVGQSLKRRARANAALTPTAIASGAGRFSVGGWFLFTQATPSVASFGLTTNTSVPQNEALFLGNNPDNGNFTVFGFSQNADVWRVSDPTSATIRYPITVHAVDADGRIAESMQHIDVSNPGGLAQGWYFVVTTFDNGTVKLYLNTELKAIGNAGSNLKTPITLVQIANHYNSTLADAGLDSCFFSLGSVLTVDEITWLYNTGAGRNYADVVAASA